MVVAPGAYATHDATATADSSASTGTGPLFELLDTGACTVTDTPTSTGGTPTGRCGDGLSLNAQINAFSQNAAAPGDAPSTSTADASVAPIDIADFTSLDLTGIVDGLAAIDTGTVLDDVIGGLAPALQLLLEPLKDAAIAPIDDALQQALAGVEAALPLSIEIGAVESFCKATADPLVATGNGTVAGIHLIVMLGDQRIEVPIQAGTAPNSNLLVGAPEDLVNAIVDGLEDTFTASLGGALSPLNDVLDTLQAQVTSAIFAQLEPALLQALADALEPLIKGTVNKQEPVSPSSTGEIEVTSLELILADGQIGELDLARSHCGINTKGTPHGDPTCETDPSLCPEPEPTCETDPSLCPPPPGGNIPTQVDSGLGGSNQGTIIMIATAALLLGAGVTGLAGYRRMLQQ